MRCSRRGKARIRRGRTTPQGYSIKHQRKKGSTAVLEKPDPVEAKTEIQHKPRGTFAALQAEARLIRLRRQGPEVPRACPTKKVKVGQGEKSRETTQGEFKIIGKNGKSRHPLTSALLIEDAAAAEKQSHHQIIHALLEEGDSHGKTRRDHFPEKPPQVPEETIRNPNNKNFETAICKKPEEDRLERISIRKGTDTLSDNESVAVLDNNAGNNKTTKNLQVDTEGTDNLSQNEVIAMKGKGKLPHPEGDHHKIIMNVGEVEKLRGEPGDKRENETGIDTVHNLSLIHI